MRVVGIWRQPDNGVSIACDKEIADSMLAEIGGKNIEKPPQLGAWLPRWIKFPAESYPAARPSYSPICAQSGPRRLRLIVLPSQCRVR
ncbi:hypothetical protein [Mesorhizobium sp. M0619]|uniref:hypothetical protein n=1 Tax=unclassified Mesorhizobium TaxID=325217 RepID=UPI00333825BB